MLSCKTTGSFLYQPREKDVLALLQFFVGLGSLILSFWNVNDVNLAMKSFHSVGSIDTFIVPKQALWLRLYSFSTIAWYTWLICWCFVVYKMLIHVSTFVLPDISDPSWHTSRHQFKHSKWFYDAVMASLQWLTCSWIDFMSSIDPLFHPTGPNSMTTKSALASTDSAVETSSLTLLCCFRLSFLHLLFN